MSILVPKSFKLKIFLRRKLCVSHRSHFFLLRILIIVIVKKTSLWLMCSIIILIGLLNFFNSSLYSLITISHVVRIPSVIIWAKKWCFWFFYVRFWCSTLLSMIASFIISGSRPYSLFIFNNEILHAARLKLSIRGQELSYCSSRTICIKKDSFDIFTESKLLIKAKLVIKQFVINSSQFCFFVSTCIFPSVYLSLQFFNTILRLEN